MKLKDIQNKFHQELDAFYVKEEVDSFFYILIQSYYKVSRIQLAMDSDCTIDNADAILSCPFIFNTSIIHSMVHSPPLG